MKKSATLVTTALLSVGLAAAAMAAGPQSIAPTANDSTTTAPAAKSHKHAVKKHKKSTAVSTTK